MAIYAIYMISPHQYVPESTGQRASHIDRAEWIRYNLGSKTLAWLIVTGQDELLFGVWLHIVDQEATVVALQCKPLCWEYLFGCLCPSHMLKRFPKRCILFLVEDTLATKSSFDAKNNISKAVLTGAEKNIVTPRSRIQSMSCSIVQQV